MIQKSKKIFPGLVLAIFFVLAPLQVHAATATFFGPIVPVECNCTNQPNPNGGTPITTAPSYGCVLATVQNGINFGISLGIIAATLALVYAGFVWMTSGGNPEARNKGKDMLLNVLIGLVILLSAWLVVDFVMKTLYNPDITTSDGKKFGPWNSILQGKANDQCIVAKKPSPISGGLGLGKGLTTELAGTGNQLSPVPPPTAGGITGTTFTYDLGISAQRKDASPALSQLLNCMAGKLPSGVGRISSISDSAITSGSKTFAQCAAGQCQHSANSCHYGGKSCIGQSYAVDFGDGDPQSPTNLAALRSAASACGANWMTDNEDGKRTHLHVSVGASCGCN